MRCSRLTASLAVALVAACFGDELDELEPDGASAVDDDPEPGVCCLCEAAGVAPIWCGPDAEDALACEELGEGLPSGWLEWHEDCVPEKGLCPGACGGDEYGAATRSALEIARGVQAASGWLWLVAQARAGKLQAELLSRGFTKK